MRILSMSRLAIAASALAIAAACSNNGDNFNAVIPNPPGVSIVVTSNNQSATVGLALAQPIVVRVTAGPDGTGGPIGNVVVTWTVLSGGGSVSVGTSTTDSQGFASVIWTVGPVAGTNTLSASIPTGDAVIFTATGTAP
jgi:hypothetical protein